MSWHMPKLWDCSLVVLVWKNYLLKRHSPWVTVFELATPLVLFFLLLGLRIREPVSKFDGTYFGPRPLPSAGMTAVLQEFCPKNDGRDVYGFPLHKNATIGPFLDQLHRAWSNSDVLQSNVKGLSFLDQLNQSVINYTSIDPKRPYRWRNHRTVLLKSVLKNLTHVRDFLTRNLSFPEARTEQILNSVINFHDIIAPPLTTGRSKRSASPDRPTTVPHALGTQPAFQLERDSAGPPSNDAGPYLRGKELEDNREKPPPVTPDFLERVFCRGLLSTAEPTTSNHTTGFSLDSCDPGNRPQFDAASSELLGQIDRDALLRSFARRPRELDARTKSLLDGVAELQKISMYLQSLYQIIKIIPPNSCSAPPRNASLCSDDFPTAHEDLTDAPLPGNCSNDATEAPATKNVAKDDYLAVWELMQPIVCGKDKSEPSSDFELTSSQKFHLGVLIHVLTSNPKVLYAPNNTQVDDVMRKANTSFVIMDEITNATRHWHNISKRLRTILRNPHVDDLLLRLKQRNAEDAGRSSSDDDDSIWAYYPQLKKSFESNQDFLNKTAFLAQLNATDNAACGWQKLVDGISINWFKGFATEDEAVEYATTQAYHDNASIFATLIFDVDKAKRLKPHVVYKIRQNTSFTQDTTQIRLSYWRPDPFNWDFRYYEFGFVWLQDVIERSIMWEVIGKDVVSPGSYVHLMPYPCYRFDVFSMDLEHIMPLAMIFSWVYTVAMLVQHIVYEKEQRLKEVMKIMGLSNAVHWFAWFISSFMQLQVSVMTIALILKFGHVLGKSNFLIIWLFFTVYAAATIMFCFFLSVLFSRAKVASACSGIVYFMTYLPYAYMSIQEFVLHQTVPTFSKICGSLMSTTAFGLGAKYFALYELSGYGIQWNNIALTPIEGDTFSLYQAMYMLVVDIFLYAILTWYIEAVFPGQYGLPRPWYFPLTASYWMGRGGTETECCSPRRLWVRLLNGGNDVTAEENYVDFDDDVLIEPEPANLPRGIRMQKLTKKYSRSKKRAVDRLTLNLYEDQITSFLGHNGAGKTTTMSILTGLIPPTSGTAYIYDCDIRSEMLEIRKSLGMCPQHNVLFDVLSVEEHLWFYARLKGVPTSDILKEMDQFLDDIGLGEKRNSKVETLSGGMKRKLSVAIAFVGGSRTVILDEPTAGVDPYARRAIWDLIVKYKEGRTILLSTHHMDEADLLGDRIAIIANGKLQCVGSSMFLKSNYGDGYQLTLLKKNTDAPSYATEPASPSVSGECSKQAVDNKVSKFVQEHVPSAVLSSDTTHEISFTLPLEAARKGCFERLFEELPPKMDDLNVRGYGLSDTTLEEVFLKVDDRSRWESEETFSTLEKASSSSAKKLFASKELPSSENDQPSPSTGFHGHVITAAEDEDNEDDEPLLVLSDDAKPFSKTSQDDDLSRENAGNRDRDIALEWLNGASSLAGDDGAAALGGSSEEEESRLLELVFGNSSFSSDAVCGAAGDFVASSSSSKNAAVPPTTALQPSSSDAPVAGESSAADVNDDNDDDVELLDLSENNEGGGSYELTPFVRNLRILQGLLIKRFHHARRNRKAIFYQIILPALFVCIAMSVALSLPTAGDSPPLVLSPSQYRAMTQPKGNFIPLTNQQILFPVNSSDHKDAGPEVLMDTFGLPSGVGATCVLKDVVNSSFALDLDLLNRTTFAAEHGDMKLVSKYFEPLCQDSFTQGIPMSTFLPPDADASEDVDTLNKTLALALAKNRNVPCACTPDGNAYVCRRSFGIKPILSTVVTGDHLLDVTGKDPMLQYLMYTTGDFRLHRYGGLSFGEVRSYVNQTFPGWPSPLRKVAVRDAAQIFYNHKGYHSMPTYVNVMNNAILRANLPRSKGNPAAYGITVINHPMNKTAGALSLDFLLSGTDVVIAIFIIVAMSFIPASFLVFLVAEKSSRAKHLQFISGTGPTTYWLSNFLWDMLNYLFPAAVCITILQIFDLPAYTRGENAIAVVALFFLYGWSMTPMMYPASFYFDVPSTAYVCMIVLNLFVGITTVVSTFMISLFRNDDRMIAMNEQLESIFLIFPNYNLGRGLMELTYNEFMNEYYVKIGETDRVRSPFEWNLITRQLVAMAVEGVAGILITVLFEVKFFRRKRRPRVASTFSLGPRRGPLSPEDVDVANERHRVSRKEAGNEDLVVVDGVSKIYSKKQGQVLAVDKLSFGVSRGECFGLLGVNGAGKTTTFSMITGAADVTSGEIIIGGHNISSGRANERLAAQQTTGYCPQFDALFNELTPSEHLLLYARLRGIPRKDERRVVEWAIKKLDLVKHKDKPSSDLSGGNKRKLSVAIALIGDPALVLLDEPTTGMDPAARRFLWDLILDVTKSGRAVILTSHSMEECEALCSKLAIMVNGRLECFGSSQHLKHRFGDGYMVSVRTQKPDDVVYRFLDTFPSAVVKERHYHKVAFQIQTGLSRCRACDDDARGAMSLSQIFKFLEESSSALAIDDYSVSQTTLDDVFVNFAEKQRNAEAEQVLSPWKRRLSSIRERLCSLIDRRNSAEGHVGSMQRSNLHLRGSPESEALLEDNLDDDDDDQPLYVFDQTMSLSFIDSTC